VRWGGIGTRKSRQNWGQTAIGDKNKPDKEQLAGVLGRLGRDIKGQWTKVKRGEVLPGKMEKKNVKLQERLASKSQEEKDFGKTI